MTIYGTALWTPVMKLLGTLETSGRSNGAYVHGSTEDLKADVRRAAGLKGRMRREQRNCVATYSRLEFCTF
jgi:hypothetical protein